MELTTFAGVDALRVADEVEALYREVFSGPPWNEDPSELANFRPRLEENVSRAGFRLVIAVVGDEVRGFGAGWTTSPPFGRDRSYGVVLDEFGAVQVERELVGAFEVDELAVHPASQGLGLGRAVLTALCAGEPSWLLTAHRAADTVAFYRRVGWRELLPQVAEPRLAVFVSV